MAITLPELQQKLIQLNDETAVIELLDLDSETLVNTFVDKIEDRWDYIIKELGLDEDDDQT